MGAKSNRNWLVYPSAKDFSRYVDYVLGKKVFGLEVPLVRL